MLTLIDLDELHIPVSREWKERLAKNIAKAAAKREQSYNKSKGTYGGYEITIIDAAVSYCESDMIPIVIRCLQLSWNESLDFAKAYGEKV